MHPSLTFEELKAGLLLHYAVEKLYLLATLVLTAITFRQFCLSRKVAVERFDASGATPKLKYCTSCLCILSSCYQVLAVSI